jgi:hypothetical protein
MVIFSIYNSDDIEVATYSTRERAETLAQRLAECTGDTYTIVEHQY